MAAVSGPDGHWRIGQLHPGEYAVPLWVDGQPPEVIAVGAQAEAVSRTLREHRPIEGVVVGPDGLPQAGVDVWLLGEDGRPWIDRAKALQTEAAGRFACVVPAGAYTVVADPSQLGIARGVATSVEAGDRKVRIALVEGKAITVRLLTSDGTPIAHTPVEAVPGDGTGRERAGTTSASGICRLEDLRPGRYDLVARRVSLTLHDVETGTVIEHGLQGDLELSGRIRWRDFEAVRFVTSKVEAVPIAARDGVTRRHLATIEDDGTFRFTGLLEGEYRLRGRFVCRFAERRRFFVVKGNPVASAGDHGVVVRLVFAED
jgi:hypothetical protein